MVVSKNSQAKSGSSDGSRTKSSKKHSTQIISLHDAYDSDEPPPPAESNDDKLLWRQSPDESFSDWTLEISYRPTNKHNKDGGSNKEETKTDVYHVHKCNLASGPRRSEYFFRLFKDGGRFAESNERKSLIELDEIAAKVFPQLLDYVYSIDAGLEISTSSAAALYHLGGYFEMRRLRWEAKQFWLRDMSVATCGTYYEHAKILHNDKIKIAALELCAESIMEVNESSRLLHVQDEEFWINLLQARASANKITEVFSRHVSKLLAVYFTNCGASVETFQKLTLSKYLPHVHRDAAIKLIEAERKILGEEPAGSSNNNNRLTQLQQRCINAITKDWSNFDQIPQSDIALLQRQSPLLLAKALTAFATAAKKGAAVSAEEKVKEERQKFGRITARTSIRSFDYTVNAPGHPQDTQSAPPGSAVFQSYAGTHAIYYYKG